VLGSLYALNHCGLSSGLINEIIFFSGSILASIKDCLPEGVEDKPLNAIVFINFSKVLL